MQECFKRLPLNLQEYYQRESRVNTIVGVDFENIDGCPVCKVDYADGYMRTFYYYPTKLQMENGVPNKDGFMVYEYVVIVKMTNKQVEGWCEQSK